MACIVVVGIIHHVMTCRALEDAVVRAVEVPLERVAVVVAAGGKTGGVVAFGNSSTDGRRMVDGLGAVGGALLGRGHLYDEMHRHIGDDDAIFFFILICSALLSRFFYFMRERFASLKLLIEFFFF